MTDFDSFAPDVFYTRFFHWENLPAFRRAGLTADDLLPVNARMANADSARMLQLGAELRSAVEASASQLLGEPDFARTLASVPFSDGDVIVALGDSITDDGLSWAYLLDAVLRLSGRRVRVANHGITGHTTAEAVTRMDLVVDERPTWVLQMLGTNDARRHGHAARAPAVSLDETARNIEKITELLSSETEAKLVVITPPPVNDSAIAIWTPFTTAGLTWRDSDVRATSEVVLDAAPGRVINLRAALNGASTEHLLLPDGVHPTTKGQESILRAIVAELSKAVERPSSSAPSARRVQRER